MCLLLNQIKKETNIDSLITMYNHDELINFFDVRKKHYNTMKTKEKIEIEIEKFKTFIRKINFIIKSEKSPEEKSHEEKSHEEKSPEEKSPEEKSHEEKSPEKKSPEKSPEKLIKKISNNKETIESSMFQYKDTDYYALKFNKPFKIKYVINVTNVEVTEKLKIKHYNKLSSYLDIYNNKIDIINNFIGIIYYKILVNKCKFKEPIFKKSDVDRTYNFNFKMIEHFVDDFNMIKYYTNYFKDNGEILIYNSVDFNTIENVDKQIINETMNIDEIDKNLKIKFNFFLNGIKNYYENKHNEKNLSFKELNLY
jgi:hypothetical protein